MRKTKTSSRLFALLLTLVMLAGLFPAMTQPALAVDVSGLPEFTSWAAMGTDTEFKISSEASLRALASAVAWDDANGTYKMSGITFYLAKDIALTGDWTPIGNTVTYPADAFAGTFDGQGYTISGLSITATTYQGLFSRTNGATIKNLNVEGNINCGTSNYVGGIAGWAQNTRFENCSFAGSVKGGYTGGIVGSLNSTGTVITSCVNTANVEGTYAGGILGYNTANNTITDCYNTGKITGSTRSGGIIGQSTGTISNCYSIGEIVGTGTATFGGIYGFSGATINNCYYLHPADNTKAGGTPSGTGVTKINAPADLPASMLGSAWKDDPGFNGGYPVLDWQGAHDLPPSIRL
ncbi:MAG: hypothetical protein LBH95_08910, partial [Oscillospiraceae bacterium]|nr:hypothetical protein [Oscillospiraceae bacterium]